MSHMPPTLRIIALDLALVTSLLGLGLICLAHVIAVAVALLLISLATSVSPNWSFLDPD